MGAVSGSGPLAGLQADRGQRPSRTGVGQIRGHMGQHSDQKGQKEHTDPQWKTRFDGQ